MQRAMPITDSFFASIFRDPRTGRAAPTWHTRMASQETGRLIRCRWVMAGTLPLASDISGALAGRRRRCLSGHVDGSFPGRRTPARSCHEIFLASHPLGTPRTSLGQILDGTQQTPRSAGRQCVECQGSLTRFLAGGPGNPGSRKKEGTSNYGSRGVGKSPNY